MTNKKDVRDKAAQLFSGAEALGAMHGATTPGSQAPSSPSPGLREVPPPDSKPPSPKAEGTRKVAPGKKVRKATKRQSDKTPVADEAHVRQTFYMAPSDMVLLESERLKRISRGAKKRQADLSCLVREAVRQVYG